jgi:hypothetical protein
MLRVALGAGLLAIMAGCSGQTSPQQANRGHSLPPPPMRSAAAAPVGDPGEAVWHLRAGLNVAALSCRGRGRTPVAGSYAQLLSRHRSLLAQAYAAEQRRYGKGFDRHQTQLYNRFSNQNNPVRFCGSAAGVAKRAVAMDSPSLARNARSLLSEID